MVFVSHDRYFIDKLATRVFEIGDGKVEVYPGNYEDYLWRKQGGSAKQDERIRQQLKASCSPSSNRHQTAIMPRTGRCRPQLRQAMNPIKRKQMEDRIRELEAGNQPR